MNHELIDKLIKILTDEVTLYKELLFLLQEEKRVLSIRRKDELYQLANKIETIVLKVRGLEEVRGELVLKVAKSSQPKPLVCGKGFGVGVNLSRVIEVVEEPHKKQLKKLHSQLIALIDSIKELNTENSIIIRRSIENIKTAFLFLKELSSFETYQSSGRMG